MVASPPLAIALLCVGAGLIAPGGMMAAPGGMMMAPGMMYPASLGGYGESVVMAPLLKALPQTSNSKTQRSWLRRSHAG